MADTVIGKKCSASWMFQRWNFIPALFVFGLLIALAPYVHAAPAQTVFDASTATPFTTISGCQNITGDGSTISNVWAKYKKTPAVAYGMRFMIASPLYPDDPNNCTIGDVLAYSAADVSDYEWHDMNFTFASTTLELGKRYLYLFGCTNTGCYIGGSASDTYTGGNWVSGGGIEDAYFFSGPFPVNIAEGTLQQFKSDAISAITEGTVTLENRVFFGATIQSLWTGTARLEVEMKPTSEPFTGEANLFSTFVPSGSKATVVADNLPDGSYHWQARVTDNGGNTTPWQEFGVPGNADFYIYTAPLVPPQQTVFNATTTRPFVGPSGCEKIMGDGSSVSNIHLKYQAPAAGLNLSPRLMIGRTVDQDIRSNNCGIGDYIVYAISDDLNDADTRDILFNFPAVTLEKGTVYSLFMGCYPAGCSVGGSTNDDYPGGRWTSGGGIEDAYFLSDDLAPNQYGFSAGGVTMIPEDGFSADGVIIFRAKPWLPTANPQRLEVELKLFDHPFANQANLWSAYVSLGTFATTSVSGLSDGPYHWQARMVDSNNNPSPWREFGAPANVDFNVNTRAGLFNQTDYSTHSQGSHYSDNWYQLGRGFSGIISSLTLRGYVDYPDFFASHVYLNEFNDQNYANLSRTYTISDNAPFTAALQEVTIDGLDIPIDINKYYRLRTYQDRQNASVILNGTNATGTAMWNEFFYGIGRIEHYYQFYPYIVANAVAPPALANPQQFKSDVTSTIDEGQITTEDTVIFGAVLQSSSTNPLRLEVEYMTGAFTGTANATSSPVNPGSFASTTATGLLDGNYRWRARAVDVSTNAVSNWQEFGTAGNTDFVVHQVPLYTQKESPFPSLAATQVWETRQYGTGNYSCSDPVLVISTIRSCGCAITSLVMASRYYGTLNDLNNNDVNPLNFNDWLTSVTPTSTIGYTAGGGVWWASIGQYTNGQVVFVTSTDSTNLAFLKGKLDGELSFLRPTILSEPNVRNGHFVVADSKLAATYHIRDPYFYGNRYLTGGVNTTTTHNYNNEFAGIRTFKQGTVGFIPASISFVLASPAELLVTDPNGNRLGLDPVSNTSYNEISGGSYFSDSIGSGPDDATSTGHGVKTIWISSPLSGTYNVQVIGTASGTYTFQGLIYDASSTAHSATFTGIASPSQETDYMLTYSSTSSQAITTKEIYKFLGFLPPIKTDGSGIYKLGRTLPTKFQLKNANGQFVTNATATLTIAKIQDDIIVGTDEIPLSSGDADTGNLFRYDFANNQYIYNLDMGAMSVGTWQLKATLNDGTNHTVLISLRN